jgi:hypothetical protein
METQSCFLLFQDINELLRYIHQPVTEWCASYPINIAKDNKANKRTNWEEKTMTRRTKGISNDAVNNYQM